ncbi:MAG: ABC transporter permease, partial [Betaproteobacteria bacterium]|nr:ABC transporter permease [Betaproteobacteria bacterium]
MTLQAFSWSRWVGIIVKEFIQLKRDRLTFGMIIGIPVMQLILFGYAINADPKRLPTAVLAADSGPYSRSLLAAMQTSGYFRIAEHPASEADIENLLAHGRVQFA